MLCCICQPVNNCAPPPPGQESAVDFAWFLALTCKLLQSVTTLLIWNQQHQMGRLKTPHLFCCCCCCLFFGSSGHFLCAPPSSLVQNLRDDSVIASCPLLLMQHASPTVLGHADATLILLSLLQTHTIWWCSICIRSAGTFVLVIQTCTHSLLPLRSGWRRCCCQSLLSNGPYTPGRNLCGMCCCFF